MHHVPLTLLSPLDFPAKTHLYSPRAATHCPPGCDGSSEARRRGVSRGSQSVISLTWERHHAGAPRLSGGRIGYDAPIFAVPCHRSPGRKSVEAGGKRRKAKHLSVVIPRSVDVFTVWQVYSVSLLLHALFVCCFVFCLFNDFGSCGPDILSRRLSWEILHSQQRFLDISKALFSLVFLISYLKTKQKSTLLDMVT